MWVPKNGCVKWEIRKTMMISQYPHDFGNQEDDINLSGGSPALSGLHHWSARDETGAEGAPAGQGGAEPTKC